MASPKFIVASIVAFVLLFSVTPINFGVQNVTSEHHGLNETSHHGLNETEYAGGVDHLPSNSKSSSNGRKK